MFADSPMIVLSLSMLIGCAIAQNSVSEDTLEKELKKAFAEADKDGSGKITVPKLENTMKNILKKTELKTFINETDKDGNGMITYEEFSKILKKFLTPIDDETERLTDLVYGIDKNHDLIISSSELREVVRNLTEEEAGAMIKDADQNGDGMMDFIELVEKLETLRKKRTCP